MPVDWWEPAAPEGAARTRKCRRWRDKFREAFRGVKLGVRGHSSFFVHFFFAVLAVAASLALGCAAVEWCLVIGCNGLVITAELFNSAIETLFHGQDAEVKKRNQGSLDIAAGAVLIASLTAALVGLIVFGNRLITVLHIWES